MKFGFFFLLMKFGLPIYSGNIDGEPRMTADEGLKPKLEASLKLSAEISLNVIKLFIKITR